MGSGQALDLGPSTLGARLRRARQRRFVGRAGELELFRAGLEGAPWRVLFVYGPGGVGKTALLAAFAEAAETAGVPVWRVDLRGVELSPPGFVEALAGAMEAVGGTAAVATLRSGGRRVLLVDTYERAAGLDGWVREGFLPGLGDETLVVLASRDAPGGQWLEDAGWRDLLRVVALRNLAPGEARAFLRAAGVAEGVHDEVLELTHGHPLAMSLLVDVLAQRGREAWVSELDLGQAPNVLEVLLERFVAGAPSERHRQALEVCAHTRVTTEDLLRTALGGETPGRCSRGCADCHSWRRVPKDCSRTTLRGTSWTPTCAGATVPVTRTSTAASEGTWWRGSGRARVVSSSARRPICTSCTAVMPGSAASTTGQAWVRATWTACARATRRRSSP